MADHANLCTTARIAGCGLDFDDAIVNFRHFLREQLFHEFGMRAGQENLRPTVLALNLQDDSANTLTDTGCFTRDLLVTADNTLGAAKVDNHMAELNRLDHTSDDLSAAILELLKLALTLSIADLLENDLLGRLRINTAQLDSGQRIDDEVPDLGARLQLFGLHGIDLLEIILTGPTYHVP